MVAISLQKRALAGCLCATLAQAPDFLSVSPNIFSQKTDEYLCGHCSCRGVDIPLVGKPAMVERFVMWNWFNCYLSGRHEYGKWCEPGAIFLRCMHCGRRSAGWALDGNVPAPSRKQANAKTIDTPSGSPTRVLPFDRRIAS